MQTMRRTVMPGVVGRRSAFATVGMAARCRRFDLETIDRGHPIADFLTDFRRM
jgi:hypothetical protein